MPPTPTKGTICYGEIPAVEIPRSAEFYATVFGCGIRIPARFRDPAGNVVGLYHEPAR